MPKRIILFTLQTFSTMGGIQKMTRTLGHCLYNIALKDNCEFELWSAYDQPTDLMPQYLPAQNFRAFGINKVRFILQTIRRATWPNVVIISHINLSVIGHIVKLINPKCKIWLVAHGIEVWRPLSATRMNLLKRCDKILCVSNYTKQQLISRHKLDGLNCIVFNNAIDPFMQLPTAFTKPSKLIDRYRLKDTDPVIFTLTRLASTEHYKGYEQMIKAVANLKAQFPTIKYILSGKYDLTEGLRIKSLITELNVSEQVILTGFINEDELADHFLVADLFVLPSKKEGFGIVFIEALACGLPVICGNADGSMDAILNGELGTAIDVNSQMQLDECIINYLNTPLTEDKRRQLQQKALLHFNHNEYMVKMEQLLTA